MWPGKYAVEVRYHDAITWTHFFLLTLHQRLVLLLLFE